MRDRLIELIKQAKKKTKNANCDIGRNMIFADYLLENGVIVPPCKVGDKVWEIEYSIGSDELWEKHPLETEVKAVCLLTENDYYPIDGVGKDVFLTRKEAEQTLKGGEG